jgi:TonB family protein
MKALRILLTGGLAWTLAGQAAAQPQPEPAQPHRAAPWQMDWGEHHCTLIRLPDEALPFHTALVAVPGGFEMQIFLVPRPGVRLPRGVNSVVLGPSGRAFRVTAREQVRGGARVLAISGLNRDFRDAFADSETIELKSGRHVRHRAALAAAGAAVTAMRRCTEEIARGWGVDEAALRRLRRHPITINAYGLRSADYPQGPLRAGIQGRVVVRMTVTPEGRAVECVAVESSGSAPIDAATCRSVLTRARFEPALDAEGRATTATVTGTVTWLVPS